MALPMDRKKTPTDEQEQFCEHLDKATEIVRTWPAWKQGVLGVPTPSDPDTKKNAEQPEDDKKN
jgi:hypothetical protein